MARYQGQNTMQNLFQFQFRNLAFNSRCFSKPVFVFIIYLSNKPHFQTVNRYYKPRILLGELKKLCKPPTSGYRRFSFLP